MRLQIMSDEAEVIRGWLARLGIVSVEAGPTTTIWDPRTGPRPAGPTVACIPVPAGEPWLVDESLDDVWHATADAYAGDATGLEQALRFMLHPSPAPPGLHAVYLGALGVRAGVTPAGTRVAIGPRCVVGRSPGDDLVLRTGAHSDQNLIARRHAMIEPDPDGVLVTDLGSTNGTTVANERLVDCARAPLGSEIAFANRFRVKIATG